MKFIKLLLLIALVFAGHSLWGRYSARSVPADVSGGGKGSGASGFVDAVMPQGVPANTVIILAPQNCPSDAARRADDLAGRLDRMGIPNVRRAEFSANLVDATPEQEAGGQRAGEVLNGEIPAVFINGRAKANPSLDDVAAEFRRAR